MLFQYTDNPERDFKLRNVCVATETVNVVVFLIRELCFECPSQPRNLFCNLLFYNLDNNYCKDDILCGSTFTVENSQPNEFNPKVLMI